MFFGGVFPLALGVPTRRGVGYDLVFGMDAAIPGWAFVLSFVAGPIITLVGAVVGMRSGHFERFHRDYDPETGRIDSNHPFAKLHEYVSKGEPAAADHPEKFVTNRTHLALVRILPSAVLLVYVSSVELVLSSWLQWAMVGMLVACAVGAFLVTDRVLREAVYEDYDPSWT
ncbi:hypothetical protein [Halorarum salinum]|uniref:Uncharacterized protein n=1 Tax=Halorarum salinum TaxID=2743089 RepID=A0A7D5Q9R0_9EURY|nr:hypothetical protein [Halobaculum salinum]QLG61876.1 hypothetical protein HUG12_09125 [Halobaculum salinum]